MGVKLKTKPARIHNRFDVFKKNVITGEEKQIGFAENILLDRIWTILFGASPGYFAYIHLGTGTGELSAARTSLFTFNRQGLGTNKTYTNDLATGVSSARMEIVLSELTANGVSFTEIGVANGTGSTTLCTHAFIRDMDGNPTSIEKTDVDIITFYATVYCVFEPWFYSDNCTRVFCMASWSTSALANWLLGLSTYAVSATGYFNPGTLTGQGAVRRLPSTATTEGATFTQTKTVATKTITMEIYRNSTQDNYPGYGIGAVSFDLGVTIKLVDHPDFPGTEILGEVLGTTDGSTTDYKTAFNFVKSGWTVKLDGVEVLSGVDVTEDDITGPDIGWYMEELRSYGGSMTLYIGRYTTGGSTNRSGYCEFRNPYYAKYPIYSININGSSVGTGHIAVSDDGINWTTVLTFNSGTTRIIPEQYRSKEYFRCLQASSTTLRMDTVVSNDAPTHNVFFSTPPGFITGEQVGVGDGTETVFELDKPVVDSLVVYVNDVEQTIETDYTVDGQTITFTSPVANEAVVTADYQSAQQITIDYWTKLLAKDSDHVFDFSVDLEFGEYTPE